MKFKLMIFLALTVMTGLFILPGFVDADTSPPAEGGVLPPIDLGAPQSAEYQQYLGISGKKTFTIPEIKAEVVLIEIFSMY
jgi:hypothetical protein